MKYLLIAGSRTFEDRETFDRVVKEVIGEEKEVTIIEGGAAGADTMAREYATRNGLAVLEYRPDWKRYGRAAGPKRNDEMTACVRENGGTALYFWDEESKGTKQCIASARKQGIGVTIWSTKQGAYL